MLNVAVRRNYSERRRIQIVNVSAPSHVPFANASEGFGQVANRLPEDRAFSRPISDIQT